MKKYDYNIDRVKEAVANNFSFVAAMRELGIPDKGGNNKTFKNFVRRNNIDTSHFDQYKSASIKEYVPANEYFNSRRKISSSKLLKKLLKEGYKRMEWKAPHLATPSH